MALYTSYADKRFLILDDIPEVRASLRNQVGSLGCESVTVCGTVKEALEHLKTKTVDVILCDFYLAGGTDGQQFLEFLRNRNIIGRGVLFVMITAEKSYEQVVTAAECLPDDYLLKPFTADALQLRLERLLEKKLRLAKVDQLQNKRDWPGVIAACDEIIGARDRYLFDVMRIKGNALIQAGRQEAAVAFYEEMLALRPMPWARLGLARALHLQGERERCKATLNQLIVESPRLMAAYDLLGHLHMEMGEADAAMAVLDSACVISPNSLARHRAIAAVAEEKKDFSRVEEALDKVIKKTRNSPLRETADFARLGNALTEMGAPDRAVAMLEEVRTSFKEDANNPLLAAVEALAQQKAGNPEKAAAALERALQSDSATLPEAVAMTVAKACLATGNLAAGNAVLKSVVQTNPDSKALHARISEVMGEHGHAGLAEALVKDSIAEVIQLNNEAVRRAQAGELPQAAAMLAEAAQRLPGNLQIVANAAAALYFDILQNGLDPAKLRSAQGFQQAVEAKKPDHPKLVEIAELRLRIRRKFGQGK